MDKSTQTERMKQMRERDVPWHFRAASTQGTNAHNLNTEVTALFKAKAIDPRRENLIKRRCETDAIEFGSYISLRWLLEFCGIRFGPPDCNGASEAIPPKANLGQRNGNLKQYCPDYEMGDVRIKQLEQQFGITSLKDIYDNLCKAAAHPAKYFENPAISTDTIDKLLALIEHLLSETIYQDTCFHDLWYRTAKEDLMADTLPIDDRK